MAPTPVPPSQKLRLDPGFPDINMEVLPFNSLGLALHENCSVTSIDGVLPEGSGGQGGIFQQTHPDQMCAKRRDFEELAEPARIDPFW